MQIPYEIKIYNIQACIVIRSVLAKTLTSTRKVPIHKDLKQLKLELQVNNSSIEINLDSKNHNYLSLVLINNKYITINRTIPFALPNYHRLLVTLPTA